MRGSKYLLENTESKYKITAAESKVLVLIYSDKICFLLRIYSMFSITFPFLSSVTSDTFPFVKVVNELELMKQDFKKAVSLIL